MSYDDEEFTDPEVDGQIFEASPQARREVDPASSSGSDMYQLSSSSTLLSVSKSDKSNQPRPGRTYKEDEDLSGLLPGARYSDSSGSSSLEGMKLSGSYESGDGPLIKSPEVTGKRSGNQTIEEQPNEENEANSEASHHTPEEAVKTEPEVKVKRLENAQKALAKLKPGASSQKPKTAGAGKVGGVARSKNYNLSANQFPKVSKVGKPPDSFGVQSSLPRSTGSKTPTVNKEVADKSVDEQFRTVVAEKTKEKAKQLNQFQEYQSELLRRERQFRGSPEQVQKTQQEKKSPSRVQPQPRALGANSYKLHQLAESVPSQSTQRMTLESQSGTLLSAIKLMSGMISESFLDSEVSDELTKAKKCISLIQTGAKDCVRNEIDYLEDTKTRTELYQKQLEQHQQTQAEIERLKKEIGEMNKKLASVETGKAVIKVGSGKYVRAGLLPDQALSMQVDSGTTVDLLREDPIDAVVNKIERQGTTLAEVFDTIDEDKDGVLTLKEIRAEIPGIGRDLALTDEEIQLIMKRLDENSDGVVSHEEFLSIFDPKLKNQKTYRALIGEIDASDPIVIEEMILDMRTRGKMYQEELPQLMNEYKLNLPNEQRLVKRILLLEQKLSGKTITMQTPVESGKTLDLQVKTLKFQKEEVESQFSSNIQERRSQVQSVQAALNQKMKIVAQVNTQIAKGKAESAYSQKQLENLEALHQTLSSKNQLIAVMMIQAMVRRWHARRKFTPELVAHRHAARVIQKNYKQHVSQTKEKAAVKIQTNFRRTLAVKEKENRLRKRSQDEKDAQPPSPDILEEENLVFDGPQNGSQTFSFLDPSKDRIPPVSARNVEGSLSDEQDLFLQQEETPPACEVCGLPADRICKECRLYYCAACFDIDHGNLPSKHVFEAVRQGEVEFIEEEMQVIEEVKECISAAEVRIEDVLALHDVDGSGLMSTEQLMEALKMKKLRLTDGQVANLIELAFNHFYNERLQGYEYKRLSAIL